MSKEKFPKEEAEKFKRHLKRHAWIMMLWAYLNMILFATSMKLQRPWWALLAYVILILIFLSEAKSLMRKIIHMNRLEEFIEIQTTDEHLASYKG